MRKDVTDDKNAVADILNRAEFATLALCDGEGPYSVPVNVALEGAVLYFHTGRKGRKYAALRQAAAEGSLVAFSAAVDLETKTGELACQWGYKFRSVLGAGRVRFLEGAEAKIAGLNALMRKHAGADAFPFDEKILGITEVVAIDIVRATARLKQS